MAKPQSKGKSTKQKGLAKSKSTQRNGSKSSISKDRNKKRKQHSANFKIIEELDGKLRSVVSEVTSTSKNSRELATSTASLQGLEKLKETDNIIVKERKATNEIFKKQIDEIENMKL